VPENSQTDVDTLTAFVVSKSWLESASSLWYEQWTTTDVTQHSAMAFFI